MIIPGNPAMDAVVSKARLLGRIENDHTYHPPKPGQAGRYEEIRAFAKEFAFLVANRTPESREQSLALTKIEEAVFHANAAIARNE